MYNLIFAQPGDTFIADKQSMYFHKGKTYKVSQVFLNDKNEILIFMFDKHNKEIPFNPFKWKETGKTVTNLLKRQLQTRLEFFFKNKIESFVYAKNIYDTTNEYELSFAHFIREEKINGRDASEAIARIGKRNRVAPGLPAPDGPNETKTVITWTKQI